MDLSELFSVVKQKTSFPFRKRMGNWSEIELITFSLEFNDLELWLSLQFIIKKANRWSPSQFDVLFDKTNPHKDIKGTLAAVVNIRHFCATESEWIRVYHFAKRGCKFYPKKQETV